MTVLSKDISNPFRNLYTYTATVTMNSVYNFEQLILKY